MRCRRGVGLSVLGMIASATVLGCDCGEGATAPPPDGAMTDGGAAVDGGRDGAARFDSGTPDAAIGNDAGPDAGADAGSDAPCETSRWFELGPSAFGPHCTHIIGSAFGGGISGQWLESNEADLAVDARGRIVVVFSEGWSVQPNWEVHAKTWNGTFWSALGGSTVSHNEGASREPSVALADDGTAVVAWADDSSGNSEIYVRYWDGIALGELDGSATGGGISASAGASLSPSVGLDGGRPVVAWNEEGRIYLRRWNGSAWIELGASASGMGVSGASPGGAPILRLTAAGDPVVAWTSGPIRVLRWNRRAWVGLDGAPSPSSVGASIAAMAMALDGDGQPVVAWQSAVSGNHEIYVERWGGADWVELAGSGSGGGISDSPTGLSTAPSVAVDASDRIVVAFAEDLTSGWNPEIFVERFEAGAWRELGSSASGGGISHTGGGVAGTPGWSYEPEVVIDAAGDPIVAWQDWTSGNAETYLRKWNGAEWESLGDTAHSSSGVSATPSRSIAGAVALDGSLAPVVAWLDVMGGHVIRVTRWDGSDWTSAGYPPIDLGVAINYGWDRSAPALILDDRDEPIIAWSDNLGTTFVDRWDGLAWEHLGGDDVGTGGWRPALIRDSTGPIVALTPYTTRWELHVFRYSGSTWAPLDGVGGDISGTTAASQEPALAVTRDDRLMVAFQEGTLNRGEVRLLVWDRLTWGGIGGSDGATGISDGIGRSGPPALALDADDRPVIAWFEEAGRFMIELHVLHWDGAAWVPYGDVVVADGFASIFAGGRAPALALDGDHHPVVGWTDDRTGQTQIYVRRWDGASWIDDPGAADHGGISNSAAMSHRPNLASRAGRTCIVWDEFGRESTQVLLRCADP